MDPRRREMIRKQVQIEKMALMLKRDHVKLLEGK